MNIKSRKVKYHIAYWIFVILILTLVFGRSWGNNAAAFFFVSMLLPIVLGTSYFFNFYLVPKFYLTKRFLKFTIYTFYTAIISLHLEMLVLVLSFVYMVNFSLESICPNATEVVVLAAVLYLLVFIASFILMMQQIMENRLVIEKLLDEKEKMKKSFLEITSNRKNIKIPFEDVVYIESLSDYIRVITTEDEFKSKEKISKLAERLPDMFLRIHRSFIINTERIKEQSVDEVLVENIRLNIGRSYRKEVKERLNGNEPK